jgi:hypothetical protein
MLQPPYCTTGTVLYGGITATQKRGAGVVVNTSDVICAKLTSTQKSKEVLGAMVVHDSKTL